ncbi:MAG: hypothetical protein QXT53_04690 [Ignisphaera sp.]
MMRNAPLTKFVALLFAPLLLFAGSTHYISIADLGILGSPNAICMHNNSVYIFGFENSSGVPRAFAIFINLSSNSIVKTVKGFVGGYYNCLVHGDKIYVVGSAKNGNTFSWALTVFSLGLEIEKIVIENLSNGLDVALDLAINNNSIYIAGIVNKSGDSFIRVEKRSLDTLAVESIYIAHVETGYGVVPRIGMLKDGVVIAYTNPFRGGVLIDYLDGGLHLTNSVLVKLGGYLYTIATENNCIYLGGSFGLAKVCNHMLKGFAYMHGGEVMDIKSLDTGILLLALTPVKIDGVEADVYILTKDLNELERKSLDGLFKHLLYIKPLEVNDNNYLIALSSIQGLWAFHKISIPKVEQKPREGFICNATIFMTVPYILAILAILFAILEIW